VSLVETYMRITPTPQGVSPFEIVTGRQCRRPILDTIREVDEAGAEHTLADWMSRLLKATRSLEPITCQMSLLPSRTPCGARGPGPHQGGEKKTLAPSTLGRSIHRLADDSNVVTNCRPEHLDTSKPLQEGNTSPGRRRVVVSGGSSIGGASAPPLLKFGDEKKRRRKKKSCQKTLYAKSFK